MIRLRLQRCARRTRRRLAAGFWAGSAHQVVRMGCGVYVDHVLAVVRGWSLFRLSLQVLVFPTFEMRMMIPVLLYKPSLLLFLPICNVPGPVWLSQFKCSTLLWFCTRLLIRRRLSGESFRQRQCHRLVLLSTDFLSGGHHLNFTTFASCWDNACVGATLIAWD